MENAEIKYLGDVQKLSLSPGDTIVIKAAEPLSEADVMRIRDSMSGIFEDHRVLVLDKTMELGVLHKEQD